jgi:hypothetical protein
MNTCKQKHPIRLFQFAADSQYTTTNLGEQTAALYRSLTVHGGSCHRNLTCRAAVLSEVCRGCHTLLYIDTAIRVGHYRFFPHSSVASLACIRVNENKRNVRDLFSCLEAAAGGLVYCRVAPFRYPNKFLTRN